MLLPLFLVACEQETKTHYEAIYRNHDERFCLPDRPQLIAPPTYPWEGTTTGGHPIIHAECFRCRGQPSNPPKPSGQTLLHDCQPHGLPLVDGKPYISPCLIELLNTLQEKTGKKVVITTGHRCPTHNAYCDPSPYNRGSKHLIGAEVDFYLEGLEERPQEVVDLILSLYQTSHDPDIKNFQRYEREELNISTKPWYNKQILIKLYLPHEGRDGDNGHPYPYIGIQDRSRTVDRVIVENYHRNL